MLLFLARAHAFTHKDTNANTFLDVYAALIFAIHNIIEKSQRTLTGVREIFPFLYLFSLACSLSVAVNSRIPNTYRRTFAMQKHTGRVPFIRCVWEYSLWNLWNIHTTRRACIKKHVYVLGVGWKAAIEKQRKGRCEWSVVWHLDIQPQQKINISCAKNNEHSAAWPSNRMMLLVLLFIFICLFHLFPFIFLSFASSSIPGSISQMFTLWPHGKQAFYSNG